MSISAALTLFEEMLLKAAAVEIDCFGARQFALTPLTERP